MSEQVSRPTDAALATLRAVADFIDEFGYSPSVQEVGWNRSVKSRSTAHDQLVRLRHDGFVTWFEKMPRTLRITDLGREILGERTDAA